MARGPKKLCTPFLAGTTERPSTELSSLSTLPEIFMDKLRMAPTISESSSNWCADQTEVGPKRSCILLRAEPMALPESGVRFCATLTATSSAPRPGISSNWCPGQTARGQRRFCTPSQVGVTVLIPNQDSRWTRPAGSTARPMKAEALIAEQCSSLQLLPAEPGPKRSFTDLHPPAAMASIHSLQRWQWTSKAISTARPFQVVHRILGLFLR